MYANRAHTHSLHVFSHKQCYATPDGVQTTGGFTVLVDALAAQVSQLVLCIPVKEDALFHGSTFDQPNITIHPLTTHTSRLGFLRALPALRREMRAALSQADLTLVALPGYVGTLASLICQQQHIPLFHLVMGDWGRNVLARRTTALGRWLARTLWKPALDWIMTRLTRDVLTFYDGQVLYHSGRPGHYPFTTSTLHADSFYVRSAAVLHDPLRLLYIGRLSGEKGVNVLLDALARLQRPATLHIIGTGPLESQLREQARALQLTERVTFYGFIPHGDALWQHYRRSDLFILPSLQDQQPKVLLEAMSQSLPIVATRAGGIPVAIQDGVNGLLVPPGDAVSLATAIERVLADAFLRERLIGAGLAHARQHTIEHEINRILHIVAERLAASGAAHEPTP